MALQVTHTACKKYTITHTNTAKEWNVRKVADDVVVTSGNFASGTAKFTLPAVGVYILKEADDLDAVGATDLEYVIIEDCGFIDCLKKLMLDIFCGKNPCECGDCEDSTKGLRYEINKLIGGYGLILMASMADKFEYWGIYSVDECRKQRLTELNTWLTQMELIKERCAEEDCSQSETDEEDCSSC